MPVYRKIANIKDISELPNSTVSLSDGETDDYCPILSEIQSYDRVKINVIHSDPSIYEKNLVPLEYISFEAEQTDPYVYFLCIKFTNSISKSSSNSNSNLEMKYAAAVLPGGETSSYIGYYFYINDITNIASNNPPYPDLFTHFDNSDLDYFVYYNGTFKRCLYPVPSSYSQFSTYTTISKETGTSQTTGETLYRLEAADKETYDWMNNTAINPLGFKCTLYGFTEWGGFWANVSSPTAEIVCIRKIA